MSHLASIARRSRDLANHTAFQKYLVLPEPRVRKLENKEGLPWSTYLGACGMPGKPRQTQL